MEHGGTTVTVPGAQMVKAPAAEVRAGKRLDAADEALGGVTI